MLGRIYIIRSKQTNKVYVGSTVETLNIRLREHKSHKNCTSREILKYSDAEIILIECYECEDEKQLKKREGEYQRQYDCVNIRIEGRTDKEYRQENKEKIAEKDKKYRQKNKQAILQKSKEYRENNKEAILEYQKEYYEKNKEKINEKITCECGGRYSHQNKAKHLKTKKHLKFVEIENKNTINS